MKRALYVLSALAYVLLAVPAHGDEVLMGPRVRAMLRSSQGTAEGTTPAAGSATPDVPSGQDTKSTADATKNKNTVQPEKCSDGTDQALNCDPGSVSLGGAYMLTSSSSGTPTAKSLGVFLKGEAPLKIGAKSYGRVFSGINFQEIAGQAAPVDPTISAFDVSNFRIFEIYAGYSRILGSQAGVSIAALCESWVDPKITSSTDPTPVDTATWGWGCGLGARGDDGTHLAIEAGQDTYAGDVGGVQIRLKGRYMIPGAKVSPNGDEQKFLSLYLDARLSFAPSSYVPATAVAPTTPIGRPLHAVVMYGVGIDIVPLFNALSAGRS